MRGPASDDERALGVQVMSVGASLDVFHQVALSPQQAFGSTCQNWIQWLLVSAPLLHVAGLSVAFRDFVAVRDFNIVVDEGETVALVGESGSGKSVTSLAITRLLDHAGGSITAGTVAFRDRDGQARNLAREPPIAMRRLRGPEIAMIFQEPMTSLNPVLRVATRSPSRWKCIRR